MQAILKRHVSTANLIGQFASLFFRDGTSNLKSTVAVEKCILIIDALEWH